MQNSFYYCERNSLHFLAEPLNFFTNLLFLAFSILLIKNKKIKKTRKLDAWAIGCVLYELFSSRMAFENEGKINRVTWNKWLFKMTYPNL